ncbi:MAG: CpXC domain-containing protein [Oscillospiraceae bacterium]|nr:CpXC domain-containing protein [Oscillospiraceae bacterium]
MSLNSTQNVRCPQCGQMSEVTVWNSITVKDSADLKQDLLRGMVNMFRCPACSHTALMPTPMLYHDEEKRLMISFSPCDDPILKQRLFDNVQNTSKESGELEKLEGYNLRFITDYNELLEKILIFDNGLNDKTIEVIKLMILSQEVDKVEYRVCRFGKKENGVMEFMIYDAKENQTYTSSVPDETYTTIDTSLRESGMKPYSFEWEMVDPSYATRLLQGFNN